MTLMQFLDVFTFTIGITSLYFYVCWRIIKHQDHTKNNKKKTNVTKL